MIVNPERLAKVGPVDPATGYPLWYADATGTKLGLALSADDPNTPAVGDPQPFVSTRPNAPATLPEEAFYFTAEAQLAIGGGVRPGRARVILALEAAWGGTGDVADGQQLVFARIRFRFDRVTPFATYVVTHPYGESGPLVADDRGRVAVTEDIGTAPLDFTAALQGHVAPFLRWTSGAAKEPGEADPPVGYLGNGETAHTVTGSPFGTNFVRITGPNVADAGGPRDPDDPLNPNKILTRRFVLQGRLATVVGLEVTRTVYGRDAAGAVTADVFAASEPGQTLRATLIDATGAGLPQTPVLVGAGGNYYTRVDTGTTVPAEVTVTNETDLPPTSVTVPVTDAVQVSTADYDADTQTLSVAATSSDLAAAPALTLAGDGLAGLPAAPVTNLAAPPTTLTVRSSAGGVATRAVAGV